MVEQKPSIKEQLKLYAQASVDEKRKARHRMEIQFMLDSSQTTTKSEYESRYDAWCYEMRVTGGYNVSHAEIKRRLGVSDGWINNNIKPVVHWFKTKATRDKDSSSVFYNHNDLNRYLLYCSNFAMRTVLIDISDPGYGYDKNVVEDVKMFKDLNEKPIRPNTTEYLKYIKLRTRLQNEIPGYLQALDPAKRCAAEEIGIEDLGLEDSDEDSEIYDLWSCKFHTVDDLNDADNDGARKYTGPEMFERDMYINGCIRIAIGGYDPKGNCKKKIYIDDPFIQGVDHSLLTRVSYSELKKGRNNFVKESEPEPVKEEPAEEKPLELSERQQEIKNDVLSGKWKNVFITGGAGTGKTFLTKSIISGLESAGKKVLVCAPSATAAINLDPKYGRTIHSLFMIDPKKPIPFDTNGNDSVPDSVVYSDVIVIDEISMVRMDIYKYVIKTIEKAERLRYDKEHPEDTGNGSVPKLCIFIGDFFQLQPVITNEDKADLFDNGWSYEVLKKGGFCFYTDEWRQRITKDNFIQLTEPFRQRDKEFVSMLEELRTGCYGDRAKQIKLIKQLNKYSSSVDVSNTFIKLCPRNDQVNEINNFELHNLPGELRAYESIVTYNRQSTESESSDKYITKQLDKFDASELAYKDEIDLLHRDYEDLMLLNIKVGAKIIMTRNEGNRFFNGQLGIVEGLGDNVITVRLLRNGKYGRPIEVKRVGYAAWISPDIALDADKRSFIIYQYPIKVAYAISIHRSQGMSLEGATVYPQVFSAGALYVALSRVKNPDNLFLESKISSRFIITSSDAMDLYRHETGDMPSAKQDKEKEINISDVINLSKIMDNITDCSHAISGSNPDVATRLDNISEELKLIRRSILISRISQLK